MTNLNTRIIIINNYICVAVDKDNDSFRFVSEHHLLQNIYLPDFLKIVSCCVKKM